MTSLCWRRRAGCLGALSISLSVKDLEASRASYEKFGFKVFAGDVAVDSDGNPIIVDQHV